MRQPFLLAVGLLVCGSCLIGVSHQAEARPVSLDRPKTVRPQGLLRALIEQTRSGAGTFDLSFAKAGKLEFEPGANLQINDYAVSDSGRIVVTGQQSGDSASDSARLVVAAYKNDGRLETGFGRAGTADLTVQFGGNTVSSYLTGRPRGAPSNLETYGERVWSLPDESIVVLVNLWLRPSLTENGQFVEQRILKLKRDGRVDTGFAKAGWLTLSPKPLFVNLEADGGLVVLGSKPILQRFDRRGEVDSKFGAEFKASLNLGSNVSFSLMARQPDGKILLAGTSSDQFLIVRYNLNGQLDPSFGAGGRALGHFTQNGPYSAPNDLLLQPDGGMLLIGADLGKGYTPGVVRLLADGRPDLRFNRNVSLIQLPESIAYGLYTSGALQPDGGIVIVGQYGRCSESNKSFSLRLRSDGRLDSSFADLGTKILKDCEVRNLSRVRVKNNRIYALGADQLIRLRL